MYIVCQGCCVCVDVLVNTLHTCAFTCMCTESACIGVCERAKHRCVGVWVCGCVGVT